MTDNLCPYTEYKEFGLPWLGRIPKHWEIRRSKYLFDCVDVRSSTGEEELLTVSAENGVVPRNTMKVTMFEAESYIGHKLCWPKDLVINSLWAWARGLGITKHHGIVSSAYGVYRLQKGFENYANFIHHFVRSAAFHWELRVRSKGVWTSRLQLTDDAFLGAPILLPSQPEADKIVRFLATIEDRINRFIRNRRQLIAVLNEQKQAIINQAVTRGLDPDVPLKPSGIEWLGNIPKDWEIASFGRFLRGIDQGWSPVAAEGEFTESQWAVLTLSCIRKGVFQPKAFKPIASEASVPAQLEVSDGDLLISRSNTRQLVGDCCIVKSPRPRTIISDLIYRLHIRENVLSPKFALLWLLSKTARRQIETDARGSSSTMVKLSHGHIKRWKIILPKIDQQIKIVDNVDKRLKPIHRAIELTKREIYLIREYHTRLITDVVTGKLDVRHLTQDAVKDADIIRSPRPKKHTEFTANVSFKRAVFATEIVARLHKEPTFGHVKFEKLIFLCEKRCGIDLGSTYHRMAAGPYDNRALRSIDSQMKKQKWYAVQKDRKRYQYVPLARAGTHKTYFDRYFSDIEKEFSNIIKIFRKFNTERCEIVATLYSAWEDLLADDLAVTDEEIVKEVLQHWHPSKQRIDSGRWLCAVEWMRKEGFVPKVIGRSHADD